MIFIDNNVTKFHCLMDVTCPLTLNDMLTYMYVQKQLSLFKIIDKSSFKTIMFQNYTTQNLKYMIVFVLGRFLVLGISALGFRST